MNASAQETFDVVIVGAGILGLATALRLLERAPDLRIAIVEKEARTAEHQTGHNSGVLHAGLYYQPGSLKARLCREGRDAIEQFAESHAIPIANRGKLVVAVDDSELEPLLALHQRALSNGVPGIELLDADRLHEIEPNVVGVAAIWSPTTSVIDFRRVADAIAEDLVRQGVTLMTGRRVTGFWDRARTIVVQTPRGDVLARNVVTCGGVQSDRLARLSGHDVPGLIVPFRGDYFDLSESAAGLVRGLIYPVPDPRFPFLGVHFTRGVDDRVHAGPNAVLALSRDGYRKRDLNPKDLFDIVTDRGFLRLAMRYWRTGSAEMARDLSKRLFLANLRRYLPDLQLDDLRDGPSGVRAQLVRPNGTLVDDFVFHGEGRFLHVLNAPSPAATASFAIGDEIATRAIRQFDLRSASS